MVNLKSASFVVIMLLHEGLIHIQSQKKPRLQRVSLEINFMQKLFCAPPTVSEWNTMVVKTNQGPEQSVR